MDMILRRLDLSTIFLFCFVLIYFYLEDNCFTILCWFLPNINRISHRYTLPQVREYRCPLPLELPSHFPSHHPSRLSQGTRFELPVSYKKFPLAISFTYGNRNASMPLSRFIQPSPSHIVSTSLFSVSTSPLLPCKKVYLYHLSRIHLNLLIYGICFSN